MRTGRFSRGEIDYPCESSLEEQGTFRMYVGDYRKPFCLPLVLPIKMKLSSRMIDSRLPRKGSAIIFLFHSGDPAYRTKTRQNARTTQPGLLRGGRGWRRETFLTLSILNGVGSRYTSARRFDADDVADFIRNFASLVCRSSARLFRTIYVRSSHPAVRLNRQTNPTIIDRQHRIRAEYAMPRLEK